MSRYHLDFKASVPAVVQGGGRKGWAYHPELAALQGVRASGVYCILQNGQALYIGESHTGRLFDTITRHFRAWKVDPGQDAQGRRRGGTTYNRDAVRVVWMKTTAADAQAAQYALIQQLQPRDNDIDGSSAVDGGGSIPV